MAVCQGAKAYAKIQSYFQSACDVEFARNPKWKPIPQPTHQGNNCLYWWYSYGITNVLWFNPADDAAADRWPDGAAWTGGSTEQETAYGWCVCTAEYEVCIGSARKDNVDAKILIFAVHILRRQNWRKEKDGMPERLSRRIHGSNGCVAPVFLYLCAVFKFIAKEIFGSQHLTDFLQFLNGKSAAF